MAKTGIRVSVLGGGSSYTPELVDGLIRRPDMPVERITLQDIPEGRDKLGIVTDFARRLVAHAGLSISIESTLDRVEALQGADFICAQYRVGGLQARARDESIPLRYGAIGQETVGAGGFAKALRTIPVALEIASDIQRICPRAWLLNFTNPAGMITQAILNRTAVRTVGLCNGPTNLRRAVALGLDVDPGRISLEVCGLNHLSFARAIYLDGQDVADQVLAAIINDPDAVIAHFPGFEWALPLIRGLKMIPSDYLRYYWMTDWMVARQQDEIQAGKGTRATQVMALEADLFKRYQDPDVKDVPHELMKRGGAFYSEVAVGLMEALVLNRSRDMVLNVRNGSTLPDLGPDAVVEVSCIVDGRGARSLAQGPMPTRIRGLVQHVKAYEDLTINAAVSGDRDEALWALINNPLIPSAQSAERILADILKENAAFLPAFVD